MAHPECLREARPSFRHARRSLSQVLTQVYPDPRNVDDELVESIRVPALNPNAPEVRVKAGMDFYPI